MCQRIVSTGTFQAILFFTVLFASTAFADFATISGDTPGAADRWSATGGATSFRFDPGLLEELDLTLIGPARAPGSDMPGSLEFTIGTRESLEFWAPWAAWDGFAAGELQHSGRLTLEWPGGRLDSEGFSLRPGSAETLVLVDSSGNSLFRLDYVHTMLYPDENRMTLWNMDVSLTPWLATHMGYPDLAGMVIASAFTKASLDIPFGGQTEGGCVTPNWHDGVNFFNDVELSNLGSVQQVARQAGVRVAIAPSATLRNVGTADVPWFQKFTTVPPATFNDYPEPYSRDQHPFLVWAMYRVVDDIPQQIGQSAVKHAFFTVNGSCSCSGGNILWAANGSPNGQGCTDTYGVGTNDSPFNLGIRDELPAFTGAWEQCGSMFAPGATPPGPCSQTNSGSTGDEFERRLVVDESELQTAGASYYFEGWYVIRDDIDIFNTMAHKSVTPTFGSTWTFPAGSHTEGPAIDSWVSSDPGEQGPDEAHVRERTDNGHYSLAVKVTPLGGDNYRYVYALMNYDFDPRFESLSLLVPDGVTLQNIQFLDGDSDAANDWEIATGGGRLTFTAPQGAALEWGYMATFVFEADQAPVEGVVELSAEEQPMDLTPLVLALTDTYLRRGFEN